MKEKIKWYREVLELEPGSRIFFPLAKLLAEDGQTDEAVVTLRLGLAKHPDHVEARLMLVELLSRQQSIGAVRREVDDLSSLFAGYPGFWQAWSDHLAKNPAMQDASVAMRFFSETMHGRKLDWTSVIEAGLKAILMEGGDSAFKKSGSEASGISISGSGLHAQAVTDKAVSPDKGEPVLNSDPDKSDELASPQPSAPLRVVSAKLKRQPQKKTDAVPEPEVEIAKEESNEEALSLRTRTMADILADQGDFAAAAEIYQELADKASGNDKKELLSRLEELQVRAGETPPPVRASEEFDDDDEEAGLNSPESSRLVDLLESLAERLEERSR